MSQTRMKIPEALRPAYRAARKARWAVTRTDGNHLKWTSPAGDFVITPASPRGGRHSIANTLAELRRAGLTW
jgi:hypothetical protein